MNEPYGSNQAPLLNQNQPIAPTQPVQPSGWAPQPSVPAAPMSSPFETQPIPNITGPASAPSDQMSGPVMMEPAGPKSSTWLFVILAILAIAGLFFLASWMGWINIGKLLGTKPSPTATVSPSSTPVVIVNKNDATRKTDLINLKTALMKYFNAKQSYPVSISLSKTSDSDTPLKVLVPDYISSLPLDPLSPNSFYGYKSVDGKSFELTAALEDTTDPSGFNDGDLVLYKVTDISPETPITSNPAASETGSITPSASQEPTANPTIDSQSSSSSSNTDTSTSTDTSSSSDTSSNANASADASTLTP